MTNDDATILRLLAESLRSRVMSVRQQDLFAEACDRIAGVAVSPGLPKTWPPEKCPRCQKVPKDGMLVLVRPDIYTCRGCVTAAWAKAKGEVAIDAGVRGSSPVVASAGDPTGESTAPAPSTKGECRHLSATTTLLYGGPNKVTCRDCGASWVEEADGKRIPIKRNQPLDNPTGDVGFEGHGEPWRPRPWEEACDP